MGRMLLLIVVAGSTCALVLWLLAPRLLSHGSPSINTPVQNTDNKPAETPTPNTQYPTPSSPSTALPHIAPVQSPEQKAVNDYEAQRAPFYTMLHQQFADLLVDGRPALDDRSILVLYATRRDATIVTDLLTRVVTPYAYAYGFRHVRFYLPNPRGSVEHYALAAEANYDEQGRWQAFQHGA